MSAAAASSCPMQRELITVLLVSPRDDDRESLQALLGHSNWRLLVATDCRTAVGILRRKHVPVVICHCSLPDGAWTDLLEEVGKLPHPPKVIVSSPLADHALWGEVLNLGCYDLFPTPFAPEEVFRVVSLAWHSWKQEYEQQGRTPRQGPSRAFPNSTGV